MTLQSPPIAVDKVREALAAYDAASAECPLTKAWWPKDKPCPRCKATGNEGCGVEVRASVELIATLRALAASPPAPSAVPDLVRRWQEDQREFFKDDILEIVTEYATWREAQAARSSAVPDGMIERARSAHAKIRSVVDLYDEREDDKHPIWHDCNERDIRALTLGDFRALAAIQAASTPAPTLTETVTVEAPASEGELEKLRAQVAQADYPCSPHCAGYLREQQSRAALERARDHFLHFTPENATARDYADRAAELYTLCSEALR